MIFEYFKVRDTDASVLDFNGILKVDLQIDNIQSFNTRWDETVIAMNKVPDGEMLDNLFYRPLQQSETAEAIAVSVPRRCCSNR